MEDVNFINKILYFNSSLENAIKVYYNKWKIKYIKSIIIQFFKFNFIYLF